jgi:hypothetical protein
MTAETFMGILDKLPDTVKWVNLQGEGEPLLHPQFFDFARIIKKRGYGLKTITNGSHPDFMLLGKYFPIIGVSLDTLDPIESIRVGRTQPKKVMENIKTYLNEYGPGRMVIHVVNYGQPMQALRDFLIENRLPAVEQPLQSKLEYQQYYPPELRVVYSTGHKMCRNLKDKQFLFYNVNGLARPCCFIRSPDPCVTITSLEQDFKNNQVPLVCRGCSKLQE